MKKLLLLLLIISNFCIVHAQNRYTGGYLYTIPWGTKERFEYIVSTHSTDGAFKTVYKIFKPGTRKNRYTIVVSHSKEDKKVTVEVTDEELFFGSMNGKEETEYELPSLKPFGFQGNMALFIKSAPSQLAVQFMSSKFEYVKVLNFLGSYSDNIYQFFIFNPQDKIVETKSAN